LSCHFKNRKLYLYYKNDTAFMNFRKIQNDKSIIALNTKNVHTMIDCIILVYKKLILLLKLKI